MVDDLRKPFTETQYDNYIIRIFDPEYPEHLYKWHSDPEDRIVEILTDSDWRFQFDNEIPIPMLAGDVIKIPQGVIHRIIRGSTVLTIKIYM